MKFFENLESKLSYKDILEVDCAFSVSHMNYGKSPRFNGKDSKNTTINSRKDSLSSEENSNDVDVYSFDGTEENLDREERIELWENYWLENINAFEKLIETLPDSVVTVYVGRQAIETGIKYILIKEDKEIPMTHDLGKLANELKTRLNIKEDYMEYIDIFCENFSEYVEGGNVEYFRYPEYKNNKFFAGNELDIGWITYNFSLIILKLLHFSKLDDKLKSL